MRFRTASCVCYLTLLMEITLAPAVGAEEPKLGNQDRQFLYWAEESGMADAALARLAADKAQNAEVKAFARRTQGAYEHIAAQLGLLAGKSGASPPQQIDKEDRDLHDNLAATRGGEFDRLFLRTLIADGRKMITLYDQEALAGKNADLLGFVADMQPRLRRLDEEARRIDLTLPGTAPLMSPSGTIAARRPSPSPM